MEHLPADQQAESLLALYPQPAGVTFEDAQNQGEQRKWSELSEPERIGFEAAEILNNPTWVNNFPLYIVRPLRLVPLEPEEMAHKEWWINIQKYYDDIDTCIAELGFDPQVIDSFMFSIGGDETYNQLMHQFGADIYREMRMRGYTEHQLRS